MARRRRWRSPPQSSPPGGFKSPDVPDTLSCRLGLAPLLIRARVLVGRCEFVRIPNQGAPGYPFPILGCLHERSQPFDRAYDHFIEWLLANERAVEDSGLIPLAEIFDDWEQSTYRPASPSISR